MSKRRSQLKLPFGQMSLKRGLVFGGSLLKNSNPKTSRPISGKHPIHIVLRSSRAVKEQSFLSPRNQKMVPEIIRRQAKALGIKVLEFANSGNHLHIMIRIKAGNPVQARKVFHKFIRAITGLIVRFVLGVERGEKHRKALGNNLTSGKRNEALVKDGPDKEPDKGNERISFWDQRPFTRIVETWTGIKIALDYILRNQLETLGIIPYLRRGKNKCQTLMSTA